MATTVAALPPGRDGVRRRRLEGQDPAVSYPIALLNNPPAPTYPEYASLWEAARRTAPRFVNPANPCVGAGAAQRRGCDWCTAVLGFPFAGLGRLTVVQDRLLQLADEAGIDPPPPDWIVQARAEGERLQAGRDEERRARARREAEDWRAVLAEVAVELEVREGSRPRVRGAATERLGHAVPTRDVYSGARTVRIHRAGRALCESPRRARPLALGTATGAPATCVRCLHWAPLVRGAAAPSHG
jgi:hypothetical protein